MSRYRFSGSSMPIGLVLVLFFIAIWILGIIGWILNIVHIFSKTPIVFDGETIIQIIGIFIAPLGAVLGWIL